MSGAREVVESPVVQGSSERVAYRVDCSPWGTAASVVSFALFDVTHRGAVDVTTAKCSGAAVRAGNVITTPAVQGLELGHVYRAECAFTDSLGNTLEWFLRITCGD